MRSDQAERLQALWDVESALQRLLSLLGDGDPLAAPAEVLLDLVTLAIGDIDRALHA